MTKVVNFTVGDATNDGVPVTLFSNGCPDANGIVFHNRNGAVVKFGSQFTNGFLGQIAKLFSNKLTFYCQYTTGTAEKALIWVLGNSTPISFAEALAEARSNNKTLAKVNGDVFTLPYMSKEDVKNFIIKVFQLEHPDANMPEKDKYAKYTVPVFAKADVTSDVSSSKGMEPTKNLRFSPPSGSAGWVPLSNGPKKEVKLPLETQAELEKLEAELSVKTKEVADNKVELAELQKQVSSLQKQIETKEAANLKAQKIFKIKSELAILEATTE